MGEEAAGLVGDGSGVAAISVEDMAALPLHGLAHIAFTHSSLTGTVEEGTAFMESDSFAKNPFGELFDPGHCSPGCALARTPPSWWHRRGDHRVVIRNEVVAGRA